MATAKVIVYDTERNDLVETSISIVAATIDNYYIFRKIIHSGQRNRTHFF